MITFIAQNAPAGEPQWGVLLYSTTSLLANSPWTPVNSQIQMTLPQNVAYVSVVTYSGGGFGVYLQPEDGKTYLADFAAGSITQQAGTVTPSWIKILVALLPWGPLDGPPLPMGFFPPWPLSIGNWMAIPGYPKVLP